MNMREDGSRTFADSTYKYIVFAFIFCRHTYIHYTYTLLHPVNALKIRTDIFKHTICRSSPLNRVVKVSKLPPIIKFWGF